ncbi:hypothetical protein D1J36_005335 [Riemerella anatipestifer]|uniref:FISUMP domain-containing protein n=1 Tax=Riemerella anatipestifer TaxID=34085 RepID=UPI0012AE6562|nr:FISUMP domain-containing protein [Riemerella anatipestifer]USL94730.1 hypothetical protein D1J36_005335 [Riemerella anatipestifer]
MKNKIIYLLILAVTLQWSKAQVVLQALEGPDWEMEVQSVRYLASVYDNNYYPMNSLDLASQPVTAQLGSQNARFSLSRDPLLNYQGQIGAYNVPSGSSFLGIQEAFERKMYHVPIKFINKLGDGSYMVIDYSKNKIIAEATIPARYIKNSATDKKVYLQLYWGEQSGRAFRSESNIEVDAFICAETPIELVQLDMNRGMGQDGKGILLTTFNITFNTSMGVMRKPLELRLLPAIPDRYANQKTNSYAGAWAADKYEHDMFYMPVIGSDGKVWLGNNLGAGYSQLISYYFNPLHQAGATDSVTGQLLTEPTTDQIKRDWRAYGSLYQWQRKSDGHELINWMSSTVGAPAYPGIGSVSNSWTDAGTNKFIIAEFHESWASLPADQPAELHNLWQSGGSNNPCPVGYHVPNMSELSTMVNSIAGGQRTTVWADRKLRLPANGSRNLRDGGIYLTQANGATYWSSYADHEWYAGYLDSWMDYPAEASQYMQVTYGFGVRCIKD